MIKVNIKVHLNYLKQLQEKAESYVIVSITIGFKSD